jgi:fermentation-respiration switch protein FrsA (DUF1100 family)
VCIVRPRFFTPLAIAVAVAALASLRASHPAARATEDRLAMRPVVGVTAMTFVDRSRRIERGPSRGQPRTLHVVVRYPALGAAARGDVWHATPAPGGPYPLVVFGHGFAVTPATYARLLDAWAAAGFVVAAPVFPLENAHAPGGPDESDLVNQPADVRFVITRLLAAANGSGSPLGVIDRGRIAVAGQSDGGETALAVAYVPGQRDPRIDAAVILSGAAFGPRLSRFAAGTPPLLAVQGTADTTNLPRNTADYFQAARSPKYLLWLLGAPHLPPYTGQAPWFGVVARASVAFLDRYLKADDAAGAQLVHDGDVAGVARIDARP